MGMIKKFVKENMWYLVAFAVACVYLLLKVMDVSEISIDLLAILAIGAVLVHAIRVFVYMKNMHSLLDSVEAIRDERRKMGATSHWKLCFYHYLTEDFSVIDGDTREYDSVELATIMTFCLNRGAPSEKEMYDMFEAIKDLLLNPYSCTIKKVGDDFFMVRKVMWKKPEMDTSRYEEYAVKMIKQYSDWYRGGVNREILYQKLCDFSMTNIAA